MKAFPSTMKTKARKSAKITRMKIIVDGLGGDKAPESVIKGVAAALKQSAELQIVLVCPVEDFKKRLAELGADTSRIEFIQADDVVLNSDHPAAFLKTKPTSTMAVCIEALRSREDIDGMVSAGPTGAILTGAVLRIGRLEGVSRPALITTLPTKKEGKSVRVLDCGANMDCKPEYLLQFAQMGTAYLKILGIENPKVGLLNVGSEEGKGNELSKASFPLLKESNIDFYGNIEADHVLDGDVDLVTTDGFAGNVYLKSMEGASFFTIDLFKAALKRNIWSKLGALMQRKGLKKVSKTFSAAVSSCAPLLGTKKLIVKTHGKATETNIAATILETQRFAKEGLLDKVSESLKK